MTITKQDLRKAVDMVYCSLDKSNEQFTEELWKWLKMESEDRIFLQKSERYLKKVKELQKEFKNRSLPKE